MRHSYVDTSAGQVHVTTAGDGAPVVLLHWTPLSARMYEAELPRLAGHGFRAIALDLIGFGRSHKPGEIWPFERHARLVAEALAAFGVRRGAVLGAHFSAPIAVELARGSRFAATALLLDGCAHLLPAEAARAIGAQVARVKKPDPEDMDARRTFVWDQAVNAYRIFDPSFTVGPRTLPYIHRFMLDYLSTGMPADFGGFQPYDMAGRLAEVRVPSCVLTAETDPLRTAQAPTVAALACGGAVTAVTLPGGHPLHDPDRKGEYADAIAAFLKGLA